MGVGVGGGGLGNKDTNFGKFKNQSSIVDFYFWKSQQIQSFAIN